MQNQKSKSMADIKKKKRKSMSDNDRVVNFQPPNVASLHLNLIMMF